VRDFANKLALVTGAAGGIGRSIALALARRGSDLALVDLDGKRLEGVGREVEGLGRRAIIHPCDVSDPQQVRALAEALRPDLLVNCAGIALMATAENTTTEDWRRIMEVNLWGPVMLCAAFLPCLKERRGHIVNVASGDGLFAIPGSAAYSTSKFALVGFTEAIRMELAGYGVGVTAVCPGLTYTPMVKSISLGGGISRERLDRLIRLVRPLLFTTPDKLAEAVLRAVSRNRPLLVHTWAAKLLYLSKRVSVRLYMALGGRAFLGVVRSLGG